MPLSMYILPYYLSINLKLSLFIFYLDIVCEIYKQNKANY